MFLCINDKGSLYHIIRLRMFICFGSETSGGPRFKTQQVVHLGQRQERLGPHVRLRVQNVRRRVGDIGGALRLGGEQRLQPVQLGQRLRRRPVEPQEERQEAQEEGEEEAQVDAGQDRPAAGPEDQQQGQGERRHR